MTRTFTFTFLGLPGVIGSTVYKSQTTAPGPVSAGSDINNTSDSATYTSLASVTLTGGDLAPYIGTGSVSATVDNTQTYSSEPETGLKSYGPSTTQVRVIWTYTYLPASSRLPDWGWRLVAAGAEVIAPVTRRAWDGISGYVADPEGNRWELAVGSDAA